jgi:hypothetical protein
MNASVILQLSENITYRTLKRPVETVSEWTVVS